MIKFLTAIVMSLILFPLSYPPKYDDEVITAFREKNCKNPIPIVSDPYLDNEEMCYEEFQVCAVNYIDENKIDYELVTVNSERKAEELGYHITHSGPCGACSTLYDLALYMEERDLTTPSAHCGIIGIPDEERGLQCFEKLGLTEECSKIWWYNTVNSRKYCKEVCFKHRDDPPNQDDGSLNPCLQCDEDYSGDIFKEYSGRTRRNSGLITNIKRPLEEIYPVYHNYY